MKHYSLDNFMADTRAAVALAAEPADCVEAVAPLLHRLINGRLNNGQADFLQPQHLRTCAGAYARNPMHIDPDGGPSLYALVWTPGQWTPIHDHGADSGIDLRRGGPILLGEGTVTTFVPNPDHIHKTGVPDERPQVVSLHLYGHTMNAFHVYDVEAGTRERIDVFHNES